MDDDHIHTDNITLGPQYKLQVLNLPVIVTAIKMMMMMMMMMMIIIIIIITITIWKYMSSLP